MPSPPFSFTMRLALLLALGASAARAYVVPDAPFAACRCATTLGAVTTPGALLGTYPGCGPHLDPAGAASAYFTFPQKWCLVDQTPALLAAAGGPCGYPVAGLGNVSTCAGASISNVQVASIAGQDASTFITGQTMLVTWSSSNIIGDNAFVTLTSPGVAGAPAQGSLVAPMRLGSATGVPMQNGTFSAVLVANNQLPPPITVTVTLCTRTGTGTGIGSACPTLNMTAPQTSIFASSPQALSILPVLSPVVDIVDNYGVSFTQRCVNFTTDGRSITVSFTANVQLAGNLVVGIGRTGGGGGGGGAVTVSSNTTLPWPAAGVLTTVPVVTAMTTARNYNVYIWANSTLASAPLYYTSPSLAFTLQPKVAPGLPVAAPTSCPSPSPSVSPTSTPTSSPTSSVTVGASASQTSSPTSSPTASLAASVSSAASVTPTPTVSGTDTPSPTPSETSTPTISVSPSDTPSPTVTPTPTLSLGSSPSMSPTNSLTSSATLSSSAAASGSPTSTPSTTVSAAASGSTTSTLSITSSATISESASASSSPASTPSPTVSASGLPTSSVAASSTVAATSSGAASSAVTASSSATGTPAAGDCSNGRRDGLETGIDCGGGAAGSGCPACGAGVPCKYSTDCARSGQAPLVCVNATLTCTSQALGSSFYAAPAAQAPLALDFWLTLSGAGVAKDAISAAGLDILTAAMLNASAGAYASPKLGNISITAATCAVRSVWATGVQRRLQQLIASAAAARALSASPPPNLTATIVLTLLLTPSGGTAAQALAALQPALSTSGELSPTRLLPLLAAALSSSTATFSAAEAWRAAARTPGTLAVQPAQAVALLAPAALATTEDVGRWGAPPAAGGAAAGAGAGGGGGGASAAGAGIVIGLVALVGGFAMYRLRTTGEFLGVRNKLVGTLGGL